VANSRADSEQERETEITPAEDRELPVDVLKRLESLPPINIYRLLAIVPGSQVPWTDLVDAIYDCELDSRLREIAICRVGGPLDEGLRIEAQCFNRSIASPDMVEGLRQFNERDHPDRRLECEPVTPGGPRQAD
jgi:hypothetical protein